MNKHIVKRIIRAYRETYHDSLSDLGRTSLVASSERSAVVLWHNCAYRYCPFVELGWPMLGCACSAVADSYLGFGNCCGSCGVNVSFWCPVPVQVRTNAQTNRQTDRPIMNIKLAEFGTVWQTLQPTPGKLEPSTSPLPKTQQSSKS